MKDKKGLDSDKLSAVDEMYSGMLVHFRECLNNDGYESAEDFVLNVLPYLDLMLARMAEELDEARKDHLAQMLESEVLEEEQYRERLTSPARYTVSLDEVSEKVSDMLEGIRNGRSPRITVEAEVGAAERRTVGSEARAVPMAHEFRAPGYSHDEMYSVPAKVRGEVIRRTDEGVRRTEAIIPEVLPPLSPEEQMLSASSARVHRTTAAQAQSMKASMTSGTTVSRTYGSSAETRMEVRQNPPANVVTYEAPGTIHAAPAPGFIPADSSLATVNANISGDSTSSGYHIVQKGEVKAGQYGSGQYGSSSYSAEAAPEAQRQVGRYSQGATNMADVAMTVEDEGYSMRDIDKYIMYANQYRQQGFYDKAFEFLTLAKELPDFYLYDYYRDEILDLEDKIERARVGGAPMGVSNVVSDTKFDSFDYISKKEKTDSWAEEVDY